jgi:hypothetical protein
MQSLYHYFPFVLFATYIPIVVGLLQLSVCCIVMFFIHFWLALYRFMDETSKARRDQLSKHCRRERILKLKRKRSAIVVRKTGHRGRRKCMIFIHFLV